MVNFKILTFLIFLLISTHLKAQEVVYFISKKGELVANADSAKYILSKDLSGKVRLLNDSTLESEYTPIQLRKNFNSYVIKDWYSTGELFREGIPSLEKNSFSSITKFFYKDGSLMAELIRRSDSKNGVSSNHIECFNPIGDKIDCSEIKDLPKGYYDWELSEKMQANIAKYIKYPNKARRQGYEGTTINYILANKRKDSFEVFCMSKGVIHHVLTDEVERAVPLAKEVIDLIFVDQYENKEILLSSFQINFRLY